MPFYDHLCEACGHEWEDFYSMVDDPPTICPKCNVEGKTRRLISNRFSVRVPKTGHELKQQIAEERGKIRNQINKDENLRANLKGESHYNNEQNAISKINDDLKQL